MLITFDSLFLLPYFFTSTAQSPKADKFIQILEAFERLVLHHSEDRFLNLVFRCKMNLCILTAGISSIRAAEYPWPDLTTFIFRPSVLIYQVAKSHAKPWY